MRYLLLPISSIHVPPFWHGEDLHSLTVLTEQLAPLVPSGQTQRQEATSSGTDTPPFSQLQVVYWQESPGLKSYKTFYPELFKIFNVKSKLSMGPQDYYFILSNNTHPIVLLIFILCDLTNLTETWIVFYENAKPVLKLGPWNIRVFLSS